MIFGAQGSRTLLAIRSLQGDSQFWKGGLSAVHSFPNFTDEAGGSGKASARISFLPREQGSLSHSVT